MDSLLEKTVYVLCDIILKVILPKALLTPLFFANCSLPLLGNGSIVFSENLLGRVSICLVCFEVPSVQKKSVLEMGLCVCMCAKYSALYISETNKDGSTKLNCTLGENQKWNNEVSQERL